MSYTVIAISSAEGLIYVHGGMDDFEDAQNRFLGVVEHQCGIANPNAFDFEDGSMVDSFLEDESNRGDVEKAFTVTDLPCKHVKGALISVHLIKN